ncbi:type IX secretion system protein PorG [Bizionia sp. KMM 8389]
MRYLTTVLLIIITGQLSQAQTHELGVFLGGSNFIGDVGSTKYIAPNQPAIGGIYKWNRSPRHAFRFSLIYTELEGKDSDSSDPRRQERDFEFNNQIIEASAGLEFTFFDWDLHDGRVKATPYLYSGISIAKHDNFFIDRQGVIQEENTSSLAYGIPMLLGFKTNILGNFIIAAEIGARYTFSDELDGSVPDYDSDSPAKFGNTNNNDWYMFTGITLTYTFGKKPCFCAF